MKLFRLMLVGAGMFVVYADIEFSTEGSCYG